MNSKQYSSFWLDEGWDSRRTSIFDEDEVVEKPKVDVVALAGYRRAISNFVSIVTGESDIKVNFTTAGSSYTDGKTVTISSKLDDKLFDSSVGLALHEGSHIKLSDFNFLKNLEYEIPRELYDLGYKKGFNDYEVQSHVKSLLNYVEDRRIDNFVFTTSPGYKGYYHSMYDKYFYSKIIDKALQSTEHTDEVIESYMFRIINLTNVNTKLGALRGLREIWNTIDIKNIGRLKDTKDAFKVASEVMFIIFNNLGDGTVTKNDFGDEVLVKASGPNKTPNRFDGMTPNEFADQMDIEEGGIDPELIKSQYMDLSPNQKKQLENAIKKQDKFMRGDIQKKKVTKKIQSELSNVEASGMTYETVGENVGWKKKGVKCLVVRKLTKELIDSDILQCLYKNRYSRYYWNNDDTKITGFVEAGIALGTKLGKKLQVRGESRDTKWSRLDSGRIDKRLIAELGFGNQRVFQTTFTESYSDAFLHISVDASGSMNGDKWTNAMTSVVAICKAASMIQNVDVVVSIRTTQDSGNYRSRNSDSYPCILLAYDSRVDKFDKVRRLFPHIGVAGTTPEGLCFEAVMDEIVPTTNDRDSYFLNFSDGMPMFSNSDLTYYNDEAINHTKKMVNEIRSRGIKVLSYYIGGEYERESTTIDFKTMYGNDAEFVDVTSVMSVSRTMNKKFLEK